eukprot:3468873-Pyramimonas_sp.AAC.1
MLELKKELQSAGIDIAAGESCQEVCMSQNLLLECNGGTPQMALTGMEQRGWYVLDTETLESSVGALSSRPDYIEQMMRTRMLGKQCILQGLIEDRLAMAS